MSEQSIAGTDAESKGSADPVHGMANNFGRCFSELIESSAAAALVRTHLSERRLIHTSIGNVEARLYRHQYLDLVTRLGMDELSTLARLSEQDNTRHIPALSLTANVAEKARNKSLELGARYFLEKPCDPNTLIKSVRSVVDGEC